MGDEVNLAARLMQRAKPGEVLATSAVAHAAEAFGFESMGEAAIKGRAARVEVFRLVERVGSVSGAPPSESTIIGREAELGTLSASLERARDGKSTIVEVASPPGMGKSRLARAIVERARALGARVFSGAGDTVERDSPLRAWRGILASLFSLEAARAGRARGRAERIVREKVVAVAPALESRLPLLNAILATRFEETELTRLMSDEVRADNTREMVVSLLALLTGASRDATHERAFRAAPALMMVFDDAHWVDSASWSLLRRVWQDIAGVMLVVLRRPPEHDDRPELVEYRELVAAPGVERIALGSLDREQTVALVGQRLRVDDVPHRLAEFVVSRAAGHPLLVDQLTAALLESGRISVGAGRCVIAPSFDEASIELPDGVEGVIAARLDRLEAIDQELVKHASVLGTSFDAPALGALSPADSAARRDLDGRLDRLCALELVEPRGGSFAFKHALVRDVVYGRLLFAQRRSLHASAAAHYEARYADDLSVWHVLLAHHYLGAENRPRASTHFGHAGEIALKSGAFRETTVFLERALELAPAELGELYRAQWKERLASAWYRLGDLPESTRRAEEAVTVFDRAIPKAGATLVSSVFGELARQVWNRVAPAALRGGLAPRARRSELRSAVHIYQNLSEVYYLGGMQGPSIYSALRQVNVAERAGVCPELAEAYGVLAIIAGLTGQRGLSKRYETLAERVVAQLDNPRSRAMWLHQRSLSHAAYGEFATVYADERKAASVFEGLGEIGRRRDALGLLGTTEYLGSRYDACEATLSELLATRTGDDRFVQEIWGSAWLGGVALVRGELDDAVKRFERSISLLDRNTVGLMEISCRGFLGLTELLRGNDGAARVSIDHTYELIEKAKGRPAGHISLDGYVAVAHAYDAWSARAGLEPKERDLLSRRARQSRSWLAGFAKVYPIAEPAARLYEGSAQASVGNARRARAELARGLAAARKLGMTCEEGRILGVMAEHEAGEKKAGLAREALALLERIGARQHSSRVQALL